MDSDSLLSLLLFGFSSVLFLQGIFTLCWMLYAWEDPREAKKRKSPKSYKKPFYSFTALLPMRHEEKVALDTIKAISAIDYPDNLKEIVIICRHDDSETINKAQEIIAKLGNENNTVLVLVDSYPINKPVSLNQGLIHARNQIIAVFDAEDEPHPDIYNIVNTVLLKEKVDVVQSGVQLMNYNSYWFSPLNVMEYFLWYKSGLNFFTDFGHVAFLGGNTVFFKKNFLKVVDGWDETSLTEDADIGIRLTLVGARHAVVYDERHATREETPTSVESFIKQRTRWNQGFLQILAKGDWKKLPQIRQKFVTLYILLAPFFPVLLFLYTPFGIWTSLTQHVPVVTAIITYAPFYILSAIISVNIIALWDFTRIYKLKFYWYLPFKVVLTYFPYMALLTLSAARSLTRYVLSLNSWEKTAHLNVHREGVFVRK